MIRIVFSLLIILILASGLNAQNDNILLTIDDKGVTKAEFEHIYKKNNSNLYDESDKKTPKEYLDLFVNFKLKVIEAEALKMDTNQTFINELAGYRSELAEPYLTDVKFNEQLVEEMYKRMKKEVNASHILLRLDKNTSPQKELEVLSKITSIRKEILSGKDFGQAAVEYSEDPSAKNNKGDLNYFSAFMMVYPFENAAYNTPVGEISEPVRTSFGYHIVKVHDIRKNQGEILVAHIMKTFPKGMTPETKKMLKSEIDAIYTQLQNGADFAELAKQKSNDKPTAVKGGEMPWFSQGRIIPEFSNPAFAIKNIGDITEPVETKFGYHIIKKIDHRPVPPFEEEKANIENKIKKDPARSITSKKAFLNKLKTEYNFTENEEGKKSLEGKSINPDENLFAADLFTIDNKVYRTTDLTAYVQKEKIKSGLYVEIYEKWIDYEITKLEDSKLEDKYPEFRFLMNEYHDGILLFNISQEKIWNYAAEDSAGLQTFYEKNKNNHLWEERFKGSIINCENTEVRDQADNLFAEGLTNEEVLEHLNSDKDVISFETGAWEKGSNPVVDFYVWEGPEPENFDGATTFIRGDKFSPEPKSLSEARGLFISDYQNYLEKEWIKELRKKYKIKVNKKLLKTIEDV